MSLWAKWWKGVLGRSTRWRSTDQTVAESLEHYATTKEMEARLFGAILVASPDLICVVDLEGRFIYANQATAHLFALEQEAVIGKSTFELGFSFASEFQRNLEQEVKHAKRSSLPLALLFIDLDGFKEVNDSLGHEAGDRLLCGIAERLKRVFVRKIRLPVWAAMRLL